ncbi:MAG: GNAT family protein [Chloroflexota bacterium]
MSPSSVWPLFGLRVRTADGLELRLPTDEQLATLIEVARAGIHPPEEMPFAFAWTDQPSPAFEREFLRYHWAARANWRAEAWSLNLAVFLDGAPIGFQDLVARDFAVLRSVGTGSWLAASHQGRGIGKAMRGAALSLAFDGLGAEEATTEAFFDNRASAGVSRALGYAENGIGRLGPRGLARQTQRFRMTRTDWAARPRPPVEIIGLAACRDLFGG